MHRLRRLLYELLGMFPAPVPLSSVLRLRAILAILVLILRIARRLLLLLLRPR